MMTSSCKLKPSYLSLILLRNQILNNIVINKSMQTMFWISLSRCASLKPRSKSRQVFIHKSLTWRKLYIKQQEWIRNKNRDLNNRSTQKTRFTNKSTKHFPEIEEKNPHKTNHITRIIRICLMTSRISYQKSIIMLTEYHNQFTE